MNKNIFLGGVIVLALLITVSAAIAAPTVTLNTPADSSSDADGDVTFAYTAGNSPTSCGLYTNITGAWAVDQTDSTITNGINTFAKTSIADDTGFIWNIMCTDGINQTWGSSNRTLTIDINDQPVWVTTIDDQPSIQEDSGELTIIADLSSYVADADNDTITFTVQTEDTSKVDCSVDSDGENLKITPASNYAGTAICKIRASDGSLYADDEFSITVANVQDAPVWSTAIPDQTMVQGTDLEIELDDYASDIDEDSLSYSVTSSDNSKLSAFISSDELELEADDDATGTVNIEVTVTDGTDSAIDSFAVTIRASEAKLTIPTELKLGNSNQDRNDTAEGNFDIENTGVYGDKTLTNTRISFDALSSFGGTVTFSTSALGTFTSELTLSSISPGNKQTVYVKVDIPEDAYGGVSTAGTIKIDSTEKSDSFDLKVETKAGLKFSDLDISVSEGEDKNLQSASEGYKIDKEAAPGTDIDISFKLENTFSESEDIEIQDIEVEILLEEMGDEDEQEEVIEVDDIDADDKSDSYTLTFHIPYQLDEDDYEISFDVTAEDENGANHKISKTIKIPVAKEKHDLAFTTSLIPSTLGCQRSAEFEVEVFNIGDNDEENIDVLVKNEDLGIDLKQRLEDLDEKWDDDDNSDKATFMLNIPADASTGDYSLIVTVYRDNKDEKEGSESVTLTIEDCSGTITTPADTVVVDTTTVTDTPEPANVDITDSLETPFTETETFTVLLIVGIVVIIALIVLLAIWGLKK